MPVGVEPLGPPSSGKLCRMVSQIILSVGTQISISVGDVRSLALHPASRVRQLVARRNAGRAGLRLAYQR